MQQDLTLLPGCEHVTLERWTNHAATEVDGTFTLREEGEVYTSGFAGKNDALRLDNIRFYDEKAEKQGR